MLDSTVKVPTVVADGNYHAFYSIAVFSAVSTVTLLTDFIRSDQRQIKPNATELNDLADIFNTTQMTAMEFLRSRIRKQRKKPCRNFGMATV